MLLKDGANWQDMNVYVTANKDQSYPAPSADSLVEIDVTRNVVGEATGGWTDLGGGSFPSNPTSITWPNGIAANRMDISGYGSVLSPVNYTQWWYSFMGTLDARATGKRVVWRLPLVVQGNQWTEGVTGNNGDGYVVMVGVSTSTPLSMSVAEIRGPYSGEVELSCTTLFSDWYISSSSQWWMYLGVCITPDAAMSSRPVTIEAGDMYAYINEPTMRYRENRTAAWKDLR